MAPPRIPPSRRPRGAAPIFAALLDERGIDSRRCIGPMAAGTSAGRSDVKRSRSALAHGSAAARPGDPPTAFAPAGRAAIAHAHVARKRATIHPRGALARERFSTEATTERLRRALSNWGAGGSAAHRAAPGGNQSIAGGTTTRDLPVTAPESFVDDGSRSAAPAAGYWRPVAKPRRCDARRRRGSDGIRLHRALWTMVRMQPAPALTGLIVPSRGRHGGGPHHGREVAPPAHQQHNREAPTAAFMIPSLELLGAVEQAVTGRIIPKTGWKRQSVAVGSPTREVFSPAGERVRNRRRRAETASGTHRKTIRTPGRGPRLGCIRRAPHVHRPTHQGRGR